MTIQLYFIESNKSTCRNAAYSVVETSGPVVLDIIPAADLQRKNITLAAVKDAFTRAESPIKALPLTEKERVRQCRRARTALGL